VKPAIKLSAEVRALLDKCDQLIAELRRFCAALGIEEGRETISREDFLALCWDAAGWEFVQHDRLPDGAGDVLDSLEPGLKNADAADRLTSAGFIA
jgi:hypothetical protein